MKCCKNIIFTGIFLLILHIDRPISSTIIAENNGTLPDNQQNFSLNQSDDGPNNTNNLNNSANFEYNEPKLPINQVEQKPDNGRQLMNQTETDNRPKIRNRGNTTDITTNRESNAETINTAETQGIPEDVQFNEDTTENSEQMPENTTTRPRISTVQQVKENIVPSQNKIKKPTESKTITNKKVDDLSTQKNNDQNFDQKSTNRIILWLMMIAALIFFAVFIKKSQNNTSYLGLMDDNGDVPLIARSTTRNLGGHNYDELNDNVSIDIGSDDQSGDWNDLW